MKRRSLIDILMGRDNDDFDREDLVPLVNSLSALALAVKANTEQRKIEFEWVKSTFGLATKQDLKEMEERMAKTLDETLEEVRALRTVADGLAALTRDIKQRLDAALSGVLTPAQQAKVDEIFAEVTAEKEETAAAIVENTPSAPPA